MKRILVTGGAGFIGSHLVEVLLNQGHEVICLDNFFTGSKENILHLMHHPYLEVMRHDVIDPLLVEVDEIYNLACPASPVHYQYNPVKTVKTNVMGMINMLGLAKRTQAKIFQASTSEVYGEPEEHPQRETYWGHVNPVGIRSCYDEGKRIAETLCMDYRRQNRVNARIVRIFNTYGPRMAEDDGRVVSNFIVQALRNQPLTVYGEGRQTRSFCYVDDLVEGFIRMMNWAEDGEDGFTFPGPVNLGNPHEITVQELADRILDLTGSSSKIERKPLPPDDPTQRRPDITLAQEKLGWTPKVPLEEGLQKTIAYFEQRLRRGQIENIEKDLILV